MPAGIYIHIPFCLSKCYYCDFYSQTASEDVINEYVDCIVKEINIVLPQLSDKKFDTIYFGGGTPSLLKINQIGKILETLFKHINSSNINEITIEANPETLTRNKLKAFLELGINRLSIGVQSTNDYLLKLLNRVHNRKRAIQSIHLARESGFDNLNVDLIFGIPEQTIDDWKKTLDTITSFQPEHLSVYNLTVERGTRLHQLIKTKQLQLPSEDSQVKMFNFAMKYLTKKNYQHYEISNYALRGFACRHNLKYWEGDEYLGIGVASHSWIDGQRFFIPPKLKLYTENVKKGKLPYQYDKVKSLRRNIAEKLMMGLRLIGGINLNGFREKYDIDITQFFESEIKELYSMKLISISKNHLRLTKRGILLANEVMSKFF